MRSSLHPDLLLRQDLPRHALRHLEFRPDQRRGSAVHVVLRAEHERHESTRDPGDARQAVVRQEEQSRTRRGEVYANKCCLVEISLLIC